MPGSLPAAIEEALSVATTVSLNIETPGEKRMVRLSQKKHYINDIIAPIKLISNLTAKGAKYERVKQTTQFIVGAAGETDSEIVKYTGRLYSSIKMNRVYFSVYQKGLGEKNLPGENTPNVFMREHRLYQVDFLLRKYGFAENEIVFSKDGNLSTSTDPKEVWAQNHPEFFPADVNRASRFSLLRVPGLGPLTVSRILKRRQQQRLTQIEDIGKPGLRLKKAQKYLVF